MYNLLRKLVDIIDDVLALLFISIAILILLIDGSKYRERSNKKEYKIIKFISYSYIAIGIIIFILLRIY